MLVEVHFKKNHKRKGKKLMPWKFYTQNYAILWVRKFNTTKLTQFTVTFRSYKPAVLYKYIKYIK